MGIDRQMSVRKRLDNLEGQMAELMDALNKVLSNQSRQIQEAVETLNAIVAHIGADKVAQIIVDERNKKAAEEAEGKKKTVAQLMQSGLLTKNEVITEKSIVTGRELDLNGEVVPPGYAQVQVATLKPEFKNQLLGQKVGFVLDTPSGKLEVQEILEYNDKPPQPEAAAQPAPTPEDAANVNE